MVWIWIFPFSLASFHTKVKQLRLPYYLLTAERIIAEFQPFPRGLAQSEM